MSRRNARSRSRSPSERSARSLSSFILIHFSSRQLLGNLLVEYLAHGERDDNLPGLLEERADLAGGVAAEIEADEEALRAVVPRHHSLERVDVGPPDLVLLLHLNRVPVVHEVEEPLPHALTLGRCRCGVDFPVDAHVPDLRLVRNPSKGNHSPVLELERRHLAKLLLAPRKVADHEVLAFGETAVGPETLRHHSAGSR